ncbi:hypothetical protein [Humibacter ginsenosidimutans]|uniref:FHA domain-containing protein n=1 Tax=Humibacter ginsenosidimutans TaxID=2599293 RepID=A0A5B8M7V6_9MICO|nr:hypothetical protein [Humibacter ginsenosidimutans]QDZ16567.1 hypothetical protein FPZ11_19070 [Humibacter ginsenosidimutans]
MNATQVPKARVADPRPGDTTILNPGTTSERPTGDIGTASAGADDSADAASQVEDAGGSVARPESLIETRPISVVSSITGHADDGSTAGAPASGSGCDGAASQPPVPYVLSFSTGERIVVVGSGLLGRRPYVQPGESFDQLVSIADHERSVSKTHLEFGVEVGDLWICDRYSANGTVIIPPAGAPHRLEPGRRYRVPRAGRVEIGDRWFDVR